MGSVAALHWKEKRGDLRAAEEEEEEDSRRGEWESATLPARVDWAPSD